MDQSKKIDVTSKSSLIALKAELLRKQDEVSKRSILNVQTSSRTIRPLPKLEPNEIVTNKGVQERAQRDAQFYEEEENELLKSRKALEEKSKLYDRLVTGQVKSNNDETFLVNFAEKAKQGSTNIEDVKEPEQETEEDLDEFQDDNADPENDWVDFTDCLGRTRRCLRKDLPSIRDRDEDLAQSLGHIKETSEPSTSSSKVDDDNLNDPRRRELLSFDMRREELRKKWETEEDIIRQKDNIHYQDVLFDEARSHGVAYYAFSRDEQLRQEQQEALQRLQEEAKVQQQTAREIKAKRQAQLQQRLQAAKRRKRERLGLPPEEDEPEMPVEESPQPIPEPEMLQREPKRVDLPIRPWDKGKDGSEKNVMTQQQWVQQKRTERPKEFAPPSSYAKSHKGTSSHHAQPQALDRLRFKSKDSKIKEFQNEESKEKLMEKKKKRSHDFKYNEETYIGPPIPSTSSSSQKSNISFEIKSTNSKIKKFDTNDPIDDSNDSLETSIGPKVTRKRAEIPPPATMEYYGPSGSVPKPVPPPNDLESSIEAGLRYLREQFEAKEHQKDKGLLDII